MGNDHHINFSNREGLVPSLTSQGRHLRDVCSARPSAEHLLGHFISLSRAQSTIVMAAVSSLVAASVAGALSGARVTGRRSAVRDIPQKTSPRHARCHVMSAPLFPAILSMLPCPPTHSRARSHAILGWVFYRIDAFGLIYLNSCVTTLFLSKPSTTRKPFFSNQRSLVTSPPSLAGCSSRSHSL